ncbi:MAG TPA: sigma-70 family RNA polymerase sigma factor [Micromonosporaceae bacterium]|nr:sigma-70 family RNA polymerase sigma factor [Micromonosporaceae bacterium]
MDDRALVAAMAAGDPRGLDGAYRRYADRLFAYCRSLVGDAETAADVVQDTFLIAGERAGQVREPDRLGAWLYAIARSQCLRALRLRRRSVPLADAYEPAADSTDPAARVQAAQVRALVTAAAAGLNPPDREVIELAVRHGLSAADVGAVLGVPANHAHARLSRARTQLETALGALLIARAGGGRCAGLDALLHGWDGQLTTLLRKRIHRHAAGCDECGLRRRELLSPAALLSAYAALPFAVAPLRRPGPGPGAGEPGRAGEPGGQGGPGGSGGAKAPNAPNAGPDGRVGPVLDPATGVPRSDEHRLRRAAAVTAAVAMLLALGGTALAAYEPTAAPHLAAVTPSVPPPTAAVSAGPGQPGFGAASPTGPAPGSAPAAAETTGGGAVGAPPPGGQPTAGPSPPPRPSTAPSTVFVVPFAVRAVGRVACAGAPSYTLTVGLTTTGGSLASARLFWRVRVLRSQPMAVDGADARATVGPMAAASVTWWVTAVAADGRTASSPATTAPNPCP